MKIFSFILLLLSCFNTKGQDFSKMFTDCNVTGSTTVFDLKKNKWIFTNEIDAAVPSLPASTFKIINLLIALETKAIKDEYGIVKWPGKTDTVLYGYRPDIYRDMTVKEAFEVSAGWVFIELAKRIGKAKYTRYLKLCNYGNGDLSKPDEDFWNFGGFAISPENQLQFLVTVYKGTAPFSKRNIGILKKVMLTEETAAYKIRSKTGWTRVNGKDLGWWVGYVEEKGNVYFFATRIFKERAALNPQFGQCRKTITKEILKQLRMIE